MKKVLSSISLFAVLLIVLQSSIFAQSTTETVYIPGSSSLEISDIVNADTSVTDYRVYQLDRGAIYYISSCFELTHPCKFEAVGDPSLRPPVLAPAIRADNSSEEWFFKFTKSGIAVEIDSLYLLSMRSDGQTLGWSRGISVQSSNCSLKLRGVVFDGWSECAIKVTADHYSLDVEDCHFRNLIHASSYYGGQAFLTDYNYPDSVSFVNNTFFSCNAYLFSIRNVGPSARFEHNTVVYSVVNPMLIRFADNLTFNNNLFYATNAWGGDPAAVIGSGFQQYPDTSHASIYQMSARMMFNGDTAYSPSDVISAEDGVVFDSTNWTRIAKNNVFYQPKDLTDFYKAWNDTVTAVDTLTVDEEERVYKRTIGSAVFINDFVQAVIDTVSDPNGVFASPNIDVDDAIVDQDPSFTDDGTLGQLDNLIEYVAEIQRKTVNYKWGYELNFPPKWPIAEDLSYSNAALQVAATDGYAVGDLNWFPEQKEDWITGVEVDDDGALPESFELSQNYPNPFNPTTTIKFTIPESNNVTLKVYNILGQEVKTLVSQEMAAGAYKVNFDATNLASGMYIYSLQSGSLRVTKKMMLLK